MNQPPRARVGHKAIEKGQRTFNTSGKVIVDGMSTSSHESTDTRGLGVG